MSFARDQKKGEQVRLDLPSRRPDGTFPLSLDYKYRGLKVNGCRRSACGEKPTGSRRTAVCRNRGREDGKILNIY